MAQGQTFTRGGIVYRDNGDGTATVVGYENEPIGGTDPQYQVDSRTVDTQINQAQADLNRTNVQTRADNVQANVTEATAPSTVRTANLPSGMMWNDPNDPSAGMRPIPGGMTDAQKQVDAEFAKMYQEMQASGGIADIRKQVQQLRGALDIMRESDTITGPVIGRLPDFVQQAINPDAINVREQVEEVVQRNLRLILGAQFTQQEGAQLISRAYNPSLQEGENIDRVTRLADQMDSALNSRESAIRYYEANGTLAGWTAPNTNQPDAPQDTPTPWDRLSAAPPQRMESSGGRGMIAAEMPEGYNEAHEQMMAGLLATGGGRIEPNAYLDARSQLDQQFGVTSDPQANLDHVGRINAYIEAGGRSIPLGVQQGERPMTEDERRRDDLVNNPLGAAAAGLLNAGGFGGAEALAPDRVAALRQDYGGEMLGGEIAGAVGGTAILGKGAREVASRFAPNMLGGGRGAQFARNLGTDMAYAGAYGANTGNGALESAAEGGIGSAIGQGLTRGLGKAVGGVRMSQPVQNMIDRNIPLTTGQTLGGMANRVEERAMSIPLIGDMIRNRRLEGIEAFNREAFQEAGQPIGANVTDIGKEGLENLSDRVGDAYTNATAGARVPLDDQFLRELQGIANAADNLPRDGRRRLAQVLDARIQPLAEAGEMTGETFQQAIRGLRSARNNPPQQFAGFEDIYKDAVSQVETALEANMLRGGGADVVEGLRSANAANRNYKTLENAANRNSGGSNTEMPFVFTPNQLQRSGMFTQKKFPGARPFADLADSGQQVLPNTIPNSGTADRAMQAALAPLGLGAVVGGGAGYLAGGTDGAQTGVAASTTAMMLAALGGTRQGQRAINEVLTVRPELARQFADQLKRRSGLFGSASVIPAIQYGN